MATGDKIALALGSMFFAGVIGATIGSKAWLLLCAPLVLSASAIFTIFWLANRHFKGLKLW